MAIEHVSLESLSIGTTDATIRVRVGRLWDTVNLRSNDVFGFNLQLIDNEGGEIHASVGPRFMPIFYGKLKEGLVYDIGDFNVTAAGDKYLTIHRPVKIDFNALTSVTEIDSHIEQIPLHKFNFANYQTVIDRTNTVKYLTDIIGVLHQVGDVVNQPTTYDSSGQKRELHLYLQCGNHISVTLWGTKTSLITPSALDETNKTIVITSLTVRNYRGNPSLGSTTATCVYTNLDIAEGNELLKSFRKRKLPSITEFEVQEQKHADVITGKSLSEITASNLPTEFGECTFEFEGNITDINLTNGWEYLSCNVCKTRVGASGSGNYCNKCGKNTEYPQHRFRLELLVDDGTAIAAVVLFDKLGEYLLKQKAEYLYQQQITEVGGSKKVATLLQQVIGNNETFHTKIDKYAERRGEKKLTATKITTIASTNISSTAEKITSKVGSSSATKVSQTKGSSRKKTRLEYNIIPNNWGHELIITKGILSHTTNDNLLASNVNPISIKPTVDIHGEEDQNIKIVRSILEQQGVQVNVSALLAPRELEVALQHLRNEKKFLRRLINKNISKQSAKQLFSLEERIKELENYIPYHNFQSNHRKVTVRINNSIGGICIKTSDLVNVANLYKFNSGPFFNIPYLQP